MKHLSKCGFGTNEGHTMTEEEKRKFLGDCAMGRTDDFGEVSFGLGLFSINEFSVCYIYVDNWRFNLVLGKTPPRICGMGAFSISIITC